MEHSRYHRVRALLKSRRTLRAGGKALRGFTLIEMVVVLSIIVVITTVAITSQSEFNKTVILANAAYDVALTLRSAETYGLGSRAVGATANAGYGLHFDRGIPGEFTVFADTYPAPSTTSVCHPIFDASAPSALPGNCVYDGAYGEQIITYKLNNGITISNFCTLSRGDWSCATGNLVTLDVVFSRPNPDPFVSVNGQYAASYPVSEVCLSFTSNTGGARYVSVAASGAISAGAASCGP